MNKPEKIPLEELFPDGAFKSEISDYGDKEACEKSEKLRQRKQNIRDSLYINLRDLENIIFSPIPIK